MNSLKLSIGDNESDINVAVYTLLCDNFIFSGQEEADMYKKQGYTTFKQLRTLSRKNKFSYPLFFAEEGRVKSLIETYNSRLYGKIDENTVLVMGSREGNLDVRSMRWIISDISEKQKIYKTYGYNTNLQDEKIVKYLKSSPKTIEDQVEYICKKVGISSEDIRSCKTKRDAFKYLCDKLSSIHIHVFREVKNAMPQNLPENMMVSGIYIRDNYNPAIFIGNELSLYPEEGIGRKIYTTVFLLVSIFKDYSFAVKINHENPRMDSDTKKKLSQIHAITNEILMPKQYLESITLNGIDDIRREAHVLKVSPTALTVRLSILKILQRKVADKFKAQLRSEYEISIKKKKAEDKRKREAGVNTGPPLSRTYKSYHGDFIDFVRNNVPETQRKSVFESRISYGRNYARYEDLYG